MKPTGTAFAKRQGGADTDPCKQLCLIDITASSLFCNRRVPESKDSNLFKNGFLTNFHFFSFYKEQLTINKRLLVAYTRATVVNSFQ